MTFFHENNHLKLAFLILAMILGGLEFTSAFRNVLD